MNVQKPNPAVDKSYAFALRIVKLYKQLCDENKEYVLSKQVLRSGTSIGANVEEAIGGQSSKDFTAKISIAYKEARESQYWLRLLKDSGYIQMNQANSLLTDCEELVKLLGSIQLTMRQKIDAS
ncbi:MAG: four helix bundle protein [Fibrobacteria bacterium]|nr:four helix bundle protein [Fibrobacteria bacterium]